MTSTAPRRGWVGRATNRVEDDRLLRGHGRYVDDIDLENGMLHAAFVRSTHANARIRGIEVDEARKAPGVRLVITGSDLGELNRPLPLLAPNPMLSSPRTQLPLAVECFATSARPLQWSSQRADT